MDENDPVQSDEFLLRRIPYNKNNLLVDTSQPQLVDGLAFRPNDNDTDGLSLFRELFASPNEIADHYRQKRGKECFIARIRADAIRVHPISMDVVPVPIDDIAGHAIIPQLNRPYCKAKINKPLCKKSQNEIAKLITINDIVHWPVTK